MAEVEPLWAELADLANRLARQAGGLIMEVAQSARSAAATKSSPTDLVTMADRSAEELVVAAISAARPQDGIQGEEGANLPGSSGVIWHIDPIDGTTNYVYGLPVFSVSIGAEHDGQMVAGAVFDPNRDRLFRAVRHGGAWCNDEAIVCSPLARISTALVATGFGYQPEQRQRQAEVLLDVLPQIRDIRRFGSAALDLCAVACGQVDAYYERGLNQWDLAAGAFIAQEAGAVVENLRGGKPGGNFLLAAPPLLFEALRDLLREAKADQPD